MKWKCPNVSKIPLLQWGFQQCLPFSWTTLRGKLSRHPIAVVGVVDMFRQCDFNYCANCLTWFTRHFIVYSDQFWEPWSPFLKVAELFIYDSKNDQRTMEHFGFYGTLIKLSQQLCTVPALILGTILCLFRWYLRALEPFFRNWIPNPPARCVRADNRLPLPCTGLPERGGPGELAQWNFLLLFNIK